MKPDNHSGEFTLIAVVAGVLGVGFFSAKAVMVKLAYQYEIDTITLLLFRMLFALPFYVAIAAHKSIVRPVTVSGKDFFLIITLGVIGYYLASYFDFLGLQYITAGQERIILFVYPTIVLLLSRVFLKKRINRYQLVAVLITYIGVVITFYPQIASSSLSGDYLSGAGFVFLSATTYAAYLVGSQALIPRLGAARFTSYAMIVACISVILHYLLIKDFRLTGYPTEVYIIGVLMAIVSTVIPSYLVSYTIKIIGAPNFSILGSLGPVFTIALAYFILEETFSVIQVVGALVVIGGIFVLSRQKG